MTLNKIKTLKEERGFTIVELLIVIVVIGILAAIVIIAYNGVTNRAKTSKAQAAASTIIKKGEAYYADKGSYPTAITNFTTAATNDPWYVASGSITISGTAISSAPSNENTVNYSTCATPAGIRVSYWDYSLTTPAVAYLYSGGATGSSTCTLVTT